MQRWLSRRQPAAGKSQLAPLAHRFSLELPHWPTLVLGKNDRPSHWPSFGRPQRVQQAPSGGVLSCCLPALAEAVPEAGGVGRGAGDGEPEAAKVFHAGSLQGRPRASGPEWGRGQGFKGFSMESPRDASRPSSPQSFFSPVPEKPKTLRSPERLCLGAQGAERGQRGEAWGGGRCVQEMSLGALRP